MMTTNCEASIVAIYISWY